MSELYTPGPNGESTDNWNEEPNRLDDGKDGRPRQVMA